MFSLSQLLANEHRTLEVVLGSYVLQAADPMLQHLVLNCFIDDLNMDYFQEWKAPIIDCEIGNLPQLRALTSIFQNQNSCCPQQSDDYMPLYKKMKLLAFIMYLVKIIRNPRRVYSRPEQACRLQPRTHSREGAGSWPSSMSTKLLCDWKIDVTIHTFLANIVLHPHWLLCHRIVLLSLNGKHFKHRYYYKLRHVRALS